MRIFNPLYERTLSWAAHKRARWFLGGVSFVEAIFFPIPADVLLAPMVLAHSRRWIEYAALATVTSVLGGVVGYFLGVLVFGWLEPWLTGSHFVQAQQMFIEWGVWIVLVAAFTPIPYKAFTISAGVMSLSLPLFVIASIVGRGARYFLVAGLLRWVGGRFEPWLRRHIEWIGWLLAGLLVAVILLHEWQ